MLRGAAQNELAQPRMTIGPHDDQIGPVIGGFREDHVADRDIRGDGPLGLRIDAVAGQMGGNIEAGDMAFVARIEE